MTRIEYLMIKLSIRLNRPVTFPQMVEAIGQEQYILCWRTIDNMVAKKWMTKTTDYSNYHMFVYEPTLQGLEVYEGKHDQYAHASFVVPIQRGF